MSGDPDSGAAPGVVTTETVGPEWASVVLGVVRAAFADRPVLDPPADALVETLDTIEARLRAHGGIVARLDDEPVGALILDPDHEGIVWLRRFGVVPGVQGRGVAGALITAAADAAAGRRGLGVFAREELPQTVGFWARQGFAEIDRHPPYVEMVRSLPQAYDAATAEEMRTIGRVLAERLEPGDLVVLSGGLGAGKTTFTQGLGEGLGVRGAVTSPTFVISRVHPSTAGGPPLVHVDAYRLDGLDELDDLDLDTAVEDAVTVVEWGSGVVEQLAESRLEVRIERSDTAPVATPADRPDPGEGIAAAGTGDDQDDEDEPLDPRVVRIQGYGPRWTFLARLPLQPPAPDQPGTAR